MSDWKASHQSLIKIIKNPNWFTLESVLSSMNFLDIDPNEYLFL